MQRWPAVHRQVVPMRESPRADLEDQPVAQIPKRIEEDPIHSAAQHDDEEYAVPRGDGGAGSLRQPVHTELLRRAASGPIGQSGDGYPAAAALDSACAAART